MMTTLRWQLAALDRTLVIDGRTATRTKGDFPIGRLPITYRSENRGPIEYLICGILLKYFNVVQLGGLEPPTS